MSSGPHEEDGNVAILPSPQYVAADAGQSNPTQSSRTDPITVFQKGEPEVLGVTQILIGICQIIFGAMLCFNRRMWILSYLLIGSGAPFWSGMLSIVSGALCAAASQKPRLGMVRSTLVVNTVSAVITSVLVILNGIVFIVSMLSSGRHYNMKMFCSYFSGNETCEGNFDDTVILIGIIGLLFIFSLLELCVSISVSVFGCKTACRSSYNEMTVIIYQNTSLNAADPCSLNSSSIAVDPSNGHTPSNAEDLPNSIVSDYGETKTQ